MSGPLPKPEHASITGPGTVAVVDGVPVIVRNQPIWLEDDVVFPKGADTLSAPTRVDLYPTTDPAALPTTKPFYTSDLQPITGGTIPPPPGCDVPNPPPDCTRGSVRLGLRRLDARTRQAGRGSHLDLPAFKGRRGSTHTSPQGRLASLSPPGAKPPPIPLPPDPHKLPTPQGGYGSYTYTYELPALRGYTPAEAEQQLAQHLPDYFPFQGAMARPVPGQVWDLRWLGKVDLGPIGDHGPVQVYAVAPDGFSLVSLPGHPEGPYRAINFQFVRSGDGVALKVSAWGPVSDASLFGPVNAAVTAHTAWLILANNINSRFPTNQSGAGCPGGPLSCGGWGKWVDVKHLQKGPHSGWTICFSYEFARTPARAPVRECMTVWIDPSGHVRTSHGIPLPGAKVTLMRATTANGPFRPIANGSGVMSPANRRNPDTTNSVGHFGWDVVSGYYKVSASHSGCTDQKNRHSRLVTTRVYRVPPPVDNIVMVMRCPDAPSVAARPTIRGKAKVGRSLSCAHGRWRNRPTAYKYAWLRGHRYLIGARRSTYRITRPDRRHPLSCVVTAFNRFGERTAISRPLKVR